DDRLWVDRFEPRSEEELAVHKRKVEDIRRWLQEAFDGGKLAKYRRFLVLTGPAGAGKTTTLRVLARSLEYEIVEWRNAPGDPFGEDGGESGMDKFEAFLARARAYRSVFAPAHTPARTLVLLEDLPNILHAPTRARFHAALRAHAAAGALAAPVVLVVSDAGVRGTHDPDMSAAGGSSARREEVVDVRVAVPDGLSAGVVTEIAFNPIAPTLLTPALKRLLERAGAAVPPGVLAAVVDGAGGDVRCAVMGLEFAWARGRGRKGRGKGGESACVVFMCCMHALLADRHGRAALEAVTRRESGLVLFHLMGKVLYNKRKGDAPSAHLTVRDKAAERALDARLKDPPPLPPWLAHEERRTSRVDVDMLYAATPIDAGLFGLYIHQNYTLFCGEVDECAGVMDALSAVDAGGGENWYETNPYTFHLHALATLHALPAPVARTGQRVCKPAFFDALRRERETRAALGQFVRVLCFASKWGC
ncbi:P-loop containing nucleoside triphosphate hydrolase protein, partial [Artomyces pyxidatus]